MDTLQIQLIDIFGVGGWRQLEEDEFIKEGDRYDSCEGVVVTCAEGLMVGNWTTYYRAKPKAETKAMVVRDGYAVLDGSKEVVEMPSGTLEIVADDGRELFSINLTERGIEISVSSPSCPEIGPPV